METTIQNFPPVVEWDESVHKAILDCLNRRYTEIAPLPPPMRG